MAILNFILGSIAVVLIGSLVFFILKAIASYRIFKKAGEKGWKAWVPILNGYTQYKFSWKTLFFWITLALCVVVAVCSKTDEYGTDYILWPGYIASAGIAVINIIGYFKLAKAFGKGVGFTFGLIFLPNIFLFILGFGSAQYVGNSSAVDSDNKKVDTENNEPEIKIEGDVVEVKAEEVETENINSGSEQ